MTYLGPLFAQGPRIATDALCDTDERAVAGILNQCVGEGWAMQVADVARATGIPARRCQSIVRHLIVDHGAPIGTSMRAPFGWYLAETPAEMDRVVELHRSRALSELTTMARLRGTCLRGILSQIQTELEVA